MKWEKRKKEKIEYWGNFDNVAICTLTAPQGEIWKRKEKSVMDLYVLEIDENESSHRIDASTAIVPCGVHARNPRED